jgi:hypothetical protein
MRILVGWMSGLAMAAAALAAPPQAAACSCIGTPIHHSQPLHGATEVPLNQAILVEGVFDRSSVRLEDEDGQPVEFELNAGPWPGCPGTSADVIPKAPLAPNTRYTLSVGPLYPPVDTGDSSSLSFTTGTDVHPDTALEPPSGGQASVVFDGPEPMCGGGTVYTCLGVDETEGIELIVRRGEEVLMRTTTLVQDDGMYVVPSVPDCVELRRRAPTGKRSAPLMICGDALNARPWVASDTWQVATQCQDGVIGAPASAGDAGAPMPAGSGAPSSGSHSEAGSQSEAGARAAESDSSHPRHETYGCGCAAASDSDAGGAGACAPVLLVLLVLRARSGVTRA